MESWQTDFPDPEVPPWRLDVRSIYHEPAIFQYPRGRAMFARFPDAERIEVPSHQGIAPLNHTSVVHGGIS